MQEMLTGRVRWGGGRLLSQAVISDCRKGNVLQGKKYQRKKLRLPGRDPLKARVRCNFTEEKTRGQRLTVAAVDFRGGGIEKKPKNHKLKIKRASFDRRRRKVSAIGKGNVERIKR